MKYGISKEVTESGKESRIFPVGIVENVVLNEVKYNPITESNQYETLEFVFKQDNTVLSHKEFPIQENVPYAQESYDRMNKRVLHIMKAFISPEESVIEDVSTFAEFAQAVSSKLLGKTTEPVRLLAVYNKKGYVSLPTYPSFIEKMSVSPSRLKIGKNHVLVRPQPQKAADVLAAPKTDDLPF